MLQKIWRFRYFITLGVFGLWMLVLDSNNLFALVRSHRENLDLKKQKQYYEKEIVNVRREREELFGNMKNLEKFAREKYLMKRDNEDLYIVLTPGLTADGQEKSEAGE